MTIYAWLTFASWIALVAYWGVRAAAVKRILGASWLWWREIAVRLGFFALIVQTLQVAAAGRALPDEPWYSLDAGPLMSLTGVVLCALGVGLAILGRASFGPDWGRRASNEDNRELVTSGPYAWVRHPIYGGMLLAMLGSALAQSVFWLLPLIAYGPRFILSARREERLLLERSPERYRDYMRRTKMLLPFVL